MNRFVSAVILLLFLLLAGDPCHAARVKAYVNRFSVSVTENRDELKQSLQTLLMSRLNCEGILAVDNKADADIQIEGSYIVFGSVFSLDGLIKTSAGTFIDRVFIQGDSQSELIPAVTEMARALQLAIWKWDPSLAGKTEGEKPVTAAVKVPASPAVKALAPEAKPAVGASPKVFPKAAPKPAFMAAAAPAAVPKKEKTSEKLWESHRLPEMLNGIAIGREMADKGIEVFATGERYLRYYLKGNKLQFVTAVMVAVDEKIVGVDVADLDQDGVLEIYVSVVRGGVPASQVYVPENNQLKKIAGELPFLLRGIAFGGREQKIYAQKMTATGVLTGSVYELVKKGERFAAGDPLPLPLFANLYNFNRFTRAKEESNIVVGHPDGYLLVYSSDGKQLWKSRDKFGGSEPVLCQPGGAAGEATTGCSLIRFPRLLVTKSGDIIVARNIGLAGNGDRKNYTKNNVLLLFWDGRGLQERSRTGVSQSYLADLSFDERSRELLLLEVEPQSDESGERGSRVVVRKIE